MALESNISNVQPNELRRNFHSFLSGSSVTSSAAMNGFLTENMVGMVVMVKATSSAGTPNYTLSLQTAFEDVDATYTDVDAISRPDLAAINDELWHVYSVNFVNCMQYARFYITLNGGDGGDDVFYFKACGLYGSFTNPIDVSLEVGDVTIGDVGIVKTPVVVNATGAAAIATTTAVAAKWALNHITLHLSGAPITSEDLSISIDANDGAAYDTVLLKQDLSASSATDIVYKPVGDLLLESGDEISVAYANTDTNTYGLRIVGELV